MSQTEVQLIKDAVIVNADVSNSAAIDVSKISGVMPLAGGTFTDDVTFTGASANVTFDKSSNELLFADNAKASFGNNGDLVIKHDGSNSLIHDNGTGSLLIQASRTDLLNAAGNEFMLTALQNGAVSLFHDNINQFETISTGFKSIAAGNRRITIGSTDASGAMLVLDGDSNGDGSGNDYAFIQHNTDGEIQIENYKSAAIRFATAGVDRYKIDASGHLLPAADSTYNIGSNSVRVANGYFDTLYGNGSNLTGITSITISGNVDNRVLTASGSDTQINGESALLFNNGHLQIMQETASSDSKLTVGNSNTPGSGVLRVEFQHGTGNTEGTNRFRYAFVEGYRASGSNDGGLKFGCKPNNAGAPTERMRIDPQGDVTPGSNNAQDFGSSSLRWANIFTNDLNLSNEGSSNDVDGTWGNYTIQEGAEDLFLINKRNGKKYKFNLTEVG